MLDTSPLPTPPPPQKLKRTASAASLPSPPPSVEPLRKRATSQRFTDSGSDTDLSSDEGVDKPATKEGRVIVGRKLLFPAVPSTSAVSASKDPGDPFLSDSVPANARDQLAVDAVRSPSPSRPPPKAPSSPPRSRRKTSRASVDPPRTPPPVDDDGIYSRSELPILDSGNNPFLSNTPPRLRRPHSPREGTATEPQTLTYVFKGVKASFPNPHYNLPDSAFERSRLPLDHPDYSPPPTRPPKRLFPEAFSRASDLTEDEENDNALRPSAGLADSADGKPEATKTNPRMSKLFVDDTGNPLPDSGPQGVRGKMDAQEIGRMAVGPLRGRG